MLTARQRGVLLDWVDEQRDKDVAHLFHKLCDGAILRDMEDEAGGKEIIRFPSLAEMWGLDGVTLADIENAVAEIAQNKRGLTNE